MSMNIYRTLFLCMVGLSTSYQSWALNLNTSITTALQHESQLKLGELQVEQRDAILQQARRSYGPNVNLVGQLGREKVVAHQGTIFPAEGSRTSRGLELQFDYPVYTWGRRQLGIQAAELKLAAQMEALSGQRAQTILQTVKVYTDVLKQQALLNLQAKTNENLKRSLFEAEKRFSAGIITRADLAQVKAQYAQGLADLVTAQSNLRISQANFNLITGLIAENLEPVSAMPEMKMSLNDSLADLAQHPAIKQAELDILAAQRQYELVQRELRPSVNLTSRIGAQHDVSSINSQSENYMVGLQVNIPLYDHGVNKANIYKANVDRSLAQQQLDTLRSSMNRDLQQSYAQLDAIRENKSAIQEAIQSASIALQYVNKELEVGTKTTFDALTAQQKLLELQTQQAINEQDEVVLVYQLLDQTGRIERSVMTESQ